MQTITISEHPIASGANGVLAVTVRPMVRTRERTLR